MPPKPGGIFVYSIFKLRATWLASYTIFQEEFTQFYISHSAILYAVWVTLNCKTRGWDILLLYQLSSYPTESQKIQQTNKNRIIHIQRKNHQRKPKILRVEPRNPRTEKILQMPPIISGGIFVLAGFTPLLSINQIINCLFSQ